MSATIYQIRGTAVSAVRTGETPVPLRFSFTMLTETKALARGLRRRDPELLDQLIEQYHYRLFRYLRSLAGNQEIAEDLFQETWIRVLERGHQYNEKWKFGTWLFTIARHLFVDYLRRKNPAAIVPDDREEAQNASEPASDTPTPLDRQIQREESEWIAQALGRLAVSYREVLVLRFQEDMSLEEISNVVAAPLPTVKSRLYRGMEMLRELLEGGRA